MLLPYTFTADRAAIDRARDNIKYEPDTGLSAEEVRAACEKIAASAKTRARARAEMLAFILENARIELTPESLLADRVDPCNITNIYRNKWAGVYRETFGGLLSSTDDGNRFGAYSGTDDFGHTCPDWEALLTDGIPGVLKRQEEALAAADTDKKRDFYSSCILVWRAIIRLLNRFADKAESCAADYPTAKLMAESLRAAATRAPRNLLEAMQVTAVIYRLGTHVENCPVRSLGRLDKLYLPFLSDDAKENEELFRYFLDRFNDKYIGANIPFTIGGEDIASDSRIEALDLTILRVYGELDVMSPKIQVRVGEHTPQSVIDKVLDLIRGGSNSLVFCNDRVVISSLVRNGHTLEDARNYVMIGCYESSTMGKEAACTCCGRISLAKAVECAMNGGRDLRTGTQLGPVCPTDHETFDGLLEAVKGQLTYFAERSIARTTAMETLYPEVSCAPILSGSMRCCMESGKDVYEGGAVYNFSSINIFGAATAADSLAAIKTLVYDEKKLTLPEFNEILKNDWEGHEKLRLLCKNKMPKYGCGIEWVDKLAAGLTSHTAAEVNGKPNGRGGSFRAGAFSIDWRFDYGKKTPATADGRRAGETLSKNFCASDSADREGVTAMMQSCCTFNGTELSNGGVLDVVLHPTAVAGDDGRDAMRGLLKTFLRRDGFAVQFNVLDPAVLRRAQTEPEKYATLQVRLCGWNVYFVNLSRTEQDEFIRQSEQA